jgi:hypothetical protein
METRIGEICITFRGAHFPVFGYQPSPNVLPALQYPCPPFRIFYPTRIPQCYYRLRVLTAYWLASVGGCRVVFLPGPSTFHLMPWYLNPYPECH